MNKIYSIMPTESFFEQASKIVLDKCYDKTFPEKLAETEIWVPSLRISQTLQDEITKQLGDFAILPNIKTISFDESDIQSLQFYNADEEFLDVEFLSPASKMLYFAKAINIAMPDWTFQQCFTESSSLIKLHQDLQNYNVSLEELQEAVPFELAEHWEKNLQLVKVVFYYYEEFLKENNKQDKYIFQNKLVDLYVKKYTTDYSKNVIAIGFSDTTSLGKKVFAKIKNLTNGCFIFPYIDKNIDGYTLEPSHAQFAIHKLLLELEINKNDIDFIGDDKTEVAFLNNMFLPANETYKWYDEKVSSLQNIKIVNAETLLEEAKAIALIMREALIDKNKTCALISPNRMLAQNVIQELKKWDVYVNDSAGIALKDTEKGQLALNIIDVLVESFNIDNIVSLITNKQISQRFKFDFQQAKKDFINLGITGSNVDNSLKALEKKIKQELPWQTYKANEKEITSALNILTLLKQLANNINIDETLSLQDWCLKHLDLLLMFATEDLLFDGDDGKALAEVFSELRKAESSSKINLKTYLQVIKLLLEKAMVRQTTNLHPRLFIWGAPEARLQKLDKVIIADFNDATWPGKIKTSLWLNPSIRAQLNMPDMSISAGLNANDLFSQLVTSEVFITRSKKDENGETLPSRFLIRLENSSDNNTFKDYIKKGDYYLKLIKEQRTLKVKNYLNTENQDSKAVLSSNNKFPDYMSASSVKDLANCPYKFYLSKVLYIKEIEDTQEVGNNLWGTTVHLMLETFFKGNNLANLEALSLPLDKNKEHEYHARFNIIINHILDSIDSDIIDLSWRNKLNVIAKSFVEISLKDLTKNIQTEVEIKANGFKAIVDRVDYIEEEGSYKIIDYKTGKPPSRNDIIKFKDPQLLVESYIFEQNKKTIADMSYLHVKGYGANPIEENNVTNGSKNDISFDEMKYEGFKMLESLKDNFKQENSSYYPYAYGTSKQKENVCKYCPYSGICRKFKL